MQSDCLPPNAIETSVCSVSKIIVSGACFALATGHMSTYMCGITDLTPWRQWLRDAPALPPNRQEALPQIQKNGKASRISLNISRQIRAQVISAPVPTNVRCYSNSGQVHVRGLIER